MIILELEWRHLHPSPAELSPHDVSLREVPQDRPGPPASKLWSAAAGSRAEKKPEVGTGRGQGRPCKHLWVLLYKYIQGVGGGHTLASL